MLLLAVKGAASSNQADAQMIRLAMQRVEERRRARMRFHSMRQEAKIAEKKGRGLRVSADLVRMPLGMMWASKPRGNAE